MRLIRHEIVMGYDPVFHDGNRVSWDARYASDGWTLEIPSRPARKIRLFQWRGRRQRRQVERKKEKFLAAFDRALEQL